MTMFGAFIVCASAGEITPAASALATGVKAAAPVATASVAAFGASSAPPSAAAAAALAVDAKSSRLFIVLSLSELTYSDKSSPWDFVIPPAIRYAFAAGPLDSNNREGLGIHTDCMKLP
jgi:hypothetical protein